MLVVQLCVNIRLFLTQLTLNLLVCNLSNTKCLPSLSMASVITIVENCENTNASTGVTHKLFPLCM